MTNSVKTITSALVSTLILALTVLCVFFFSACNKPVIAPVNDENVVEIASVEDFNTAMNTENPVIKLTQDLSFNEGLTFAKDVDINLNGKKLTINSADGLKINEEVIVFITNGELNITGSNGHSAINLKGNLILDNVEYKALEGTAILPSKASSLEVIDSIITGKTYAIATNASSAVATDEVTTITITRSKIIALSDNGDNGDDCAIMMNIPSKLSIDNSMIVGDRQVIIVRGGEATIRNSTIIDTCKYATETQYLTSKWKSGNEVPMAAVVIGNRHDAGVAQTAYQYASKVIIENVFFLIQDGDNDGNSVPAIYVYANENEEFGVELNIDDSTSSIVKGTETNVVVNEL